MEFWLRCCLCMALAVSLTCHRYELISNDVSQCFPKILLRLETKAVDYLLPPVDRRDSASGFANLSRCGLCWMVGLRVYTMDSN